jgi:hypothetical protein
LTPSTRTTAAGATLAGTWRTGRSQDLHLLGSEDLFQLGLGLFFKRLELFLLIFTEVQLLHYERRQDVEAAAAAAARPAPRSPRTAGPFRPAGAGALPRRRSARTVLTPGPHRKGSQREDTTRENKQWKTSHERLL